MNRRRALTLIGAVGLTGTAGCLGEDGEISGSASPAVVPEGDQQEFQTGGPTSIDINETVEMAGVSRDVNITTWSTAYASEEDQAAMFVISTPNVSVGGQSLNPLARLKGADLITRVIDEGLARADGDTGIKEIKQEDEVELPVLDETRTVPIFSAVLETNNAEGSGGSSGIAGAENGEIPIRLYLLSITHEEDVLLAIGFHPEPLEVGEEIQSMMTAIEHPVDEDEIETNTGINETDGFL